jgi:ABC-type multidrug transport system ATPase subunit
MEITRVLRGLANERSLTVVAVVHQPSFSLLSLFDSIVLMSKGGRIAYAGPVKMMKSYFEDLGFAFPPGENAVEVCLSAISGLINSSNPEVTAFTIPDLWKVRTLVLLFC